MARGKQAKKGSVKVRDLSPKNDPKGGGKKKQQQQEKYLVVKMTDVIISS